MRFQEKEWHPRKIKLVPVEDKFTNSSGLGTMVEVFDESPLSRPFKKCLPKRVSHRSIGSYRLSLIQLCAFLHGYECLSDIEEFEGDPAIEAMLEGEVCAPRTMGDYLRDFEEEHIESLNKYLCKMSRSIRDNFTLALEEAYRPKMVHLFIDSTSHVQSGSQIEGVAWNYKNQWCLDSQVVFDEMGLCYGVQLRPGNSKSGDNSAPLIEQAFSPWEFRDEKYLSADSLYCFKEVIECLLRLGVKFTLTANDGTTFWQSHIPEITQWTEWKYTEAEIKKAGLRKVALPKVEVGWFYWQPSWNEVLRFPVVVKRTWNEEEKKWEHYGVVNNLSLMQWTPQGIMEFHNKRGNAENFIREEKYGYKLKHFPCQKLLANHAYLLLAMVAHNILRWVAVIQKPHRPHFSKKLRRRFIFIAGRVVSHARTLVIKISIKAYEEVQQLKKAWQSKPCPAFGDWLPAKKWNRPGMMPRVL